MKFTVFYKDSHHHQNWQPWHREGSGIKSSMMLSQGHLGSGEMQALESQFVLAPGDCGLKNIGLDAQML